MLLRALGQHSKPQTPSLSKQKHHPEIFAAEWSLDSGNGQLHPTIGECSHWAPSSVGDLQLNSLGGSGPSLWSPLLWWQAIEEVPLSSPCPLGLSPHFHASVHGRHHRTRWHWQNGQCQPWEFLNLHCWQLLFFFFKIYLLGLPWWHSGWESACQCREHGFEPWSGKIPHAAEQLSPWATTTELCASGACAPQQERPR